MTFFVSFVAGVVIVVSVAVLTVIVMGLFATGGHWNPATSVPIRPESFYIETPEQRAVRMRAYRKEQRRLYRRRRSAAFRWYNRTPRAMPPSAEFLRKLEDTLQ